jgi:MATE family multidrug resistance protein
MAGALIVLGWRELAPYLERRAPNLLDWRPLRRMLVVGLPIGAQMVLEAGLFGGVSLLMGWLGVAQMAAHQVALNLSSLTFMVPLGVSSSAAVIVGHAVGRGDAPGVRRSTVAALSVGAAFMGGTAMLLIGFPETFAGLYSRDAAVLELAVLLLPIAGVFQVFDGLQVVALGLLRGLGDTRVPMLVTVLGFWLVGMPVSVWLGFGAGFGAPGLWWGLVAGLVMVASFLLLRLRHRLHSDLVRLVIDAPPVGRRAE